MNIFYFLFKPLLQYYLSASPIADPLADHATTLKSQLFLHDKTSQFHGLETSDAIRRATN